MPFAFNNYLGWSKSILFYHDITILDSLACVVETMQTLVESCFRSMNCVNKCFGHHEAYNLYHVILNDAFKVQTIRSSVLSTNMCVNIGHILLFPFLDCRFLTGRFQISLFLRLRRPRSWCLAYTLDAMLVSMVIYGYNIYMYRLLYLSGLSYVVLYIVFV